MAVVESRPIELGSITRESRRLPTEGPAGQWWWLDEDLKLPFLEAYERTGSIGGAAHEIGVPADAVRRCRHRDPEFRERCDAIARRRLQRASDELISALERIQRLDWSVDQLDELVNIATMPPADRAEFDGLARSRVDQAQLEAARERLYAAAREWATAVSRSPSVYGAGLELGEVA